MASLPYESKLMACSLLVRATEVYAMTRLVVRLGAQILKACQRHPFDRRHPVVIVARRVQRVDRAPDLESFAVEPVGEGLASPRVGRVCDADGLTTRVPSRPP